VKRRPLYRRFLGRRVLRLGYRIVSFAAQAWWSAFGSQNHGAKCVLVNDGEVLLVRHTYGDRRSWDFPGGFVRRREAPIAAARRELGEELGIAVPELRDLGPLVVDLGRRHDTVHYFEGELADRRLAPDDVELAEVAWFGLQSLPRRVGEYVVEVLGRLPPREPLASLETDPGSPARG
jgi:8-oxo-dGTP pyrophosphatase MutT (NUDIX family)